MKRLAFIIFLLLILIGRIYAQYQGTDTSQVYENGVLVTKYYYRNTHDADKLPANKATKSVSINQEAGEDATADWVLINGVKWATRNVGTPGTFVANPEDYGNYYQYNNGTTDLLLFNDYYYNSSYWNSTTWLPANDPSPAGYQVPSRAEMQSLANRIYVAFEWTTLNGVYGVKFTDRTNGNSIFLPATGFYDFDSDSLYFAGIDGVGMYWLNTQYEDYYERARILYFCPASADWQDCADIKSLCHTIRPIAKSEISLSKNEFNFLKEGGSDSLNIETNLINITVSSDSSWCHTTNADDPLVVKITVDKNKSTSSRSAIVTVKAINQNTEAEAIKYVLIEQEAGKEELDADWVLINGVKWATRNVGSPGKFASNPEDHGGYYQWNKNTINDLNLWDYYSSIYAHTNTWLPTNDPSPTGYRVPTSEEIQSLLNVTYVTNEWTSINGVWGRRFTDKASGKSIFLPAEGCLDYLGRINNRLNGYYRSNTQSFYNDYYGDSDTYIIYFNSDRVEYADWGAKYDGFSIRPVYKETDEKDDFLKLPVANNQKQLTCYPNPSKDKITVSYELMESQTNAIINIYNTEGQIIKKIKLKNQEVGSHNEVIAVGDLPKGIYIVVLSTNKVSSYVKLLKE